MHLPAIPSFNLIVVSHLHTGPLTSRFKAVGQSTEMLQTRAEC